MGCANSLLAANSVKDSSARFHDSYQLGKKLGEGAFGQVRIARERATAQEYAVKIIDVRHVNPYGEVTSEVDQGRVRDTRQEIHIWKMLAKHDHCVALFASFLEESLYYMVMEKCDCSLMDKLVAMPSMTEGDLAKTFRDMLKGISHVHSLNIVHRDIKPDNFLYGGSDSRTIKLCDFGLADRLPKKGKLQGCYGTAPYMSPEMISGAGYDQGTDVWSFAAMAYLMIFGDFPYMPKEVSSPAMKQAILKGTPEPTFGRGKDKGESGRVSFQDSSTDFVRALLQRRPEKRPSSDQALEYPFLQPKLPEEDLPLRHNIQKARKLTHDIKKPINPIMQRGIEELLTKLQETHVDGSVLMYFSESRIEEEKEREAQAAKGDPEISEDRIARRRSNTRHSTHSGVISEKSVKVRLEPTLDTLTTDDGTSGNENSDAYKLKLGGDHVPVRPRKS